MDDATLIKPRNIAYILRSVDSDEEYHLEGEMIVGREVECAIAIQSGHVSRYHAKINVMRSGVFIEDLHSTNGTYINGKRIKGRVRLSLGDEITFDDIAYRLTSNQSGLEQQTILSTSRPPELEDDFDEEDEELEATTQPLQAKSKSNVQPFPARNKKTATPQYDESPIEDLFPEPVGELDPADAPTVELDSQELPSKPLEPAAVSAPLLDDPLDELEDQGEPLDAPTRIISDLQIGQFVERNRAMHKEIIVGSGPRIIVMTAPLRGKYFGLDEDLTSWKIGRAVDADIRLTDKTISADHARILRVDDGFMLQTSHSKSNVLVNGLLAHNTLLQHDDNIQVGSTELVFKTDYPEVYVEPEKESLLDNVFDLGLNKRHALIGAAVILVALITVLITSNS